MDVACIPFDKTGYFSGLICDYLDEKESIRPFYHRFSRLDAFRDQIIEKQKNYPGAYRKILCNSLLSQYNAVPAPEEVLENITLLGADNTFTVVTGHQLNIFTGPLYFLYKIISTLNLCRDLRQAYPDYKFVPVYWMATEDHDLDEINYFNFRGKKLQWNREAGGAVGHMSTDGLDAVHKMFSLEVGNSDHANRLKELFSNAYLEHNDLATATRSLVNELFGEYGLVILDGDDVALKGLLAPYVKRDLQEQLSFEKVARTSDELQQLPENYGVQVNPREINYFYLAPGLRERIVFRDGRFFIVDTDLVFTEAELLAELDAYPERFSPNVVTRPLYQELVLPNLCYIGGGGELAYWLQLKSAFGAMEVTFPILLLRNSALLISEKQERKLKKLNLKVADLFMPQSSFINKKIREISNIEIDFTPQKKMLEDQFSELYELAAKTDASFLGAVKAQEVKQKKGLKSLEKRLLKAQKRKLKDQVVRMAAIQNELFPNRSLQERQLNFSELYLEMGENMIPTLIQSLHPLQLQFLVITY